MWRWPSVLLILLATISHAAPSSSGPTSDEEAEVLWREGQSAIQESRYQDTINYLQRYVDRYPGRAGYLKAHLLLGTALLELGKPQSAVEPLKYFIDGSKLSVESAEARILLGRAYLGMKKYMEAKLIAGEVEKMNSRVKLPPDPLIAAPLIRAQALLGTNRKTEAAALLDSLELQVSDQTSNRNKAQLYSLQLKLKTEACSRLPLRKAQAENQIRNQLDERGTCLLEALLKFQKILKLGDSGFAEDSVHRLTQAFRSYAHSCAHPLVSPKSISGVPSNRRFSRLEMSRFRAELSDLLVRECGIKTAKALDLLNTWKPEFPSPMEIHATQLAKTLEKHATRSR